MQKVTSPDFSNNIAMVGSSRGSVWGQLVVQLRPVASNDVITSYLNKFSQELIFNGQRPLLYCLGIRSEWTSTLPCSLWRGEGTTDILEDEPNFTRATFFLIQLFE